MMMMMMTHLLNESTKQTTKKHVYAAAPTLYAVSKSQAKFRVSVR